MKLCSFCRDGNLTEIIDFGEVAIAGGFLTKHKIEDEKKYPLAVDFCNNCYAVQVRDHIDPDVLFETDYYFSSAIQTLVNHFTDYAKEVTDRFVEDPSTAKVLEFGSNDGVLLKPLADQGISQVIGIDPAKNIVESIDDDRLTLINGFFNTKSAQTIVQEHGKVDLVMANNVYAHISDINSTTEGVYNILKDDGVFVFEVHYLGNIIEELQYDFIYHEHIYYYSLLALENHLDRHGLVIFDLKAIPIHGGSYRYYAAKKDSAHANKISDRVKELRQRELDLGYDRLDVYQEFSANVAKRKAQLMSLLDEIKSAGKTVVGYGASGRANTMIQYCGITEEDIDYIVDDAPAKAGLFTPGSHIEIKPRDVLLKDNPDYILVFAWSFYEEIVKKNQEYIKGGGSTIIPLPEVIVS